MSENGGPTELRSRAGCLRCLLRGGLASLSVVLTLAVLELGARIPGPPRPLGVSFHQCDPTVGWIGKAGDRFEVQMPTGTHTVVRNSLGMHDTEHRLGRQPGTLRIAVVGDSYVEALQVPQQMTHPQLLEDMLNSGPESPAQFEVLSFGIGGWSPGQELLFIQKAVFQFEPDIVIAFWYPGNDLSDVLPGPRYQTCSGFDCFAPYFILSEGKLTEKPWYTAPGAPAALDSRDDSGRYLALTLNRVHHWSRLYQRLGPRLTQTPQAKRGRFPARQAPWQPSARTSFAVQEGWRLNAAISSRMALETRSHGAEFRAVIVPYGPAVETLAAPLRELAPPAGIDDPSLPHRRFAKLMAEADVPCLDLQERFVRELVEANEAPYWPDGHWNARGNQIAAETVAEWLHSSGLLHRSPNVRVP